MKNKINKIECIKFPENILFMLSGYFMWILICTMYIKTQKKILNIELMN